MHLNRQNKCLHITYSWLIERQCHIIVVCRNSIGKFYFNLNFDGETGPYVQYTHARACSVLRKAEGVDRSKPDFAALSDPFSQDVVRLIEQFPDILKSAVNRSEPSMVTRFAVDLAQAFNKFYYENKVMVDEPGTRAARLLLTDVVRQVLKQALYLIGVEAPERM